MASATRALLSLSSLAALRGPLHRAPSKVALRHLSMSEELPDVSRFMTAPEPKVPLVMQQTMIRVKSPLKSLEFYCSVLGMKLIWHRDLPQYGFSVYFTAFHSGALPDDEAERFALCMNTPGCIELTWNHGTEDEKGRVYNTGNADDVGSTGPVKGGFGHLGVTVPDVYAYCVRLAPRPPPSRVAHAPRRAPPLHAWQVNS